MRNPLRSESDAFGFLLVVAVLVAIVALSGVLAGGWAALAALVGVGGGAGAGLWLRGGSAAEGPGWWERDQGSTEAGEPVRRLLVLADRTSGSPALHEVVRHRARGGDGEVLVVAPAQDVTSSRWTPEGEATVAAATARLEHAVGALRALGLTVSGEVGPDDPVEAARQAVRRFPADEILLATLPAGRSAWLACGAVDGLRKRLRLPVTHVVVEPDAADGD
ncbi:MAG: hypothetical protein R3C15_11340 [Thermoleophilia bacterium]